MLKRKRNYLIPIIGFAIFILIGSVFLYMPYTNKKSITYQDAIFTSISALTTTGFSRVCIQEQFNFWGQFVIAILMEIGALGFIIFISYYWIKKNKKIKLADMILINSSINNDNFVQIKDHTFFISKTMFRVQLFGSILLSFKFIPMYGILNGIWKAIFVTISAFSNCGFDNLGNESLIYFEKDAYIQVVIIIIMLLGNIGVFTIEDIVKNKSKKFYKLNVQTKIILIMTAILIFVPFIILKIVQPNINFLNAVFMSITSRSTGFMVSNPNAFKLEGKILLILIMFIGGSPASSAGGIKITTFVIAIMTIYETLNERKDIVIFSRKIPDSIIRKSFTIIFLFMVIIFSSTMMFYYYNNIGVINAVFESVSALTNTGLSITNSSSLNQIGNAILMILMFIGRVGPLSAVVIFLSEDNKNKVIEYPSENIMIQ